MSEIEFEIPLELDEPEVRAKNIQVFDEKINLLMKENRIGLSVKPLREIEFAEDSIKIADLRFNCIAHAHPECSYKWVRLTANFSKYKEIIIKDLSPNEVIGEPVKITTEYNGGLKFSVKQSPIEAGAEVGKNKKMEQEIYYPEITSSGVGFSSAYWDFREGNKSKLHVDRELRLLLEYPFLTKFLSAKFTLRAEVSVKGVLGHVPLIGKKEEKFEISANL